MVECLLIDKDPTERKRVSQLLGDLGATILKIENPDGGDDTRTWGPPYAPGAEAQVLISAAGDATMPRFTGSKPPEPGKPDHDAG